jgi:hypothetical protein
MSGRSSNEMSYAPRLAPHLLRQLVTVGNPFRRDFPQPARRDEKDREAWPAAAITPTNVRAGDDILLNEIGTVPLDRPLRGKGGPALR